MNPLLQYKPTILPLFIAGVLACCGLLPKAEAVVPPPDGGYLNFNTAEGQNALFSLTTGVGNTAAGWSSLFSNTDGSFNTAVGAGTLLFNVGDQSAFDGIQNTAVGAVALFNNTTGSSNTAVGTSALYSNTTASVNTAIGASALFNNTTGSSNTAVGTSALTSNTTAGLNTAIGRQALFNSTGSGNTALGHGAGFNVTTANNVICIGATGLNVSDSVYIGNIWDQSGGSQAVYVNSLGKLGQMVSAQRFKDEIKSMDRASEVIYDLKPVSFRYKPEIEPTRPLGFGLIAEEVEKISPDLVTRDSDGQAHSVRYDAVNAMLLNEFLKAHHTVQEQKATIAQLKSTDAKQEATIAKQQKQIEALAVGLQKVSAHLELSKPALQVVKNNQ